MIQHPRTAALLTQIFDEEGELGPQNAPEKWVKLARELKDELQALKTNTPAPSKEITNWTSILFSASTEYKNHVQEFPTVEGREWTFEQKFLMAMAVQDGFAEGARWMFKRWPLMIAGTTTANKFTHIESTTNFRASGFILRSKETKHAALIEQGAVRWLTDTEYTKIMHPKSSSTPST